MAKKERYEVATGVLLSVAMIILLLLCVVAARAEAAVTVRTLEGLPALTITDVDEIESPEIDGRRVSFRYPDDGYDEVDLMSDFNDWQPVEMTLDEDEGCWTVTVDMEDGRYRYQFEVSDDGQRWTAVDPANPDAATYRDRGWVSTFTVGRASRTRVVRIRSKNHRYSSAVLRTEIERLYGDDDGGVLYDRVDGFSIFAEPGTRTGDRMGPVLKGRASYGFASKQWTLDGTLLQPLSANQRLMFRLGAHSGTDYTENTGLSDLENTLGAAFFKEDYRDYYKREGLMGSLILVPNDNIRLEAGIRADDYTSLENHADWSFADGEFQPNPAIHEGLMRSLFTSLRVGSPVNHVSFEYERADSDDYGGDFDFSRVTAAYRGRLNMGRTQRFDVHLKYGSALTGTLPNQRRFAMGGIGTVRGYAYQSLLDRDPTGLDATTLGYRGGQRMLQLNLEYGMALGWDGWDGLVELEDWDEWADEDIDLSGIGGFDGMLYIFMDSGMAWEDRHADVSFSDTESSIGIGYKFGENGLRVDVARPLESGDHDPIFQVRLNRMF